MRLSYNSISQSLSIIYLLERNLGVLVGHKPSPDCDVAAAKANLVSFPESKRCETSCFVLPGRPEPQRGAEANAACVPESRTGMTLCPPDQCREIQAKEAGKIYPIGDRRSRTRLALIICNITFAHLNKREGAEVDLRGMTLLLEDLGYRVEIKINLTAKEMSTCLKDFAAREEHKTSDSTFLVLMSHGVRDGLCGVQSRDKDSDVLPIDDVFSIFNNNNCRALYEKPKVVIIQACRGTNKGVTYVSDSVVPVVPSADSASSSANYEEDAVRMVHLESDFICLYSTTLSKALSG
uniref:Caspase family p20 domain-containing protein n=1 Tax=Anolis carolinensis TaxID=28377 RepID=H9GK20_ANOCA